MKNFSTLSFTSRLFARGGLVSAALSLLACLPLSATVLDNFTGPKTGWTDTFNGGTVSQSGGQFTVVTATNSGTLTYSAKTSASFANVAGHTLEFRVDVNNVTPGNRDPNPLAILAWVPSGGAVLGSGYSLVVGAGTVSIYKGPAVLYSTNYAAAGTNIQNANITLVLRMTTSGSGVSVNGRVYKRIGNGVIAQYFTTLFEYTAVDTSGLVGQGGNAALGVKNQASATGSSAAFANLQVFDIINSVLDDFNSGLDTNKWTVFKKLPAVGDSVTVHDGQLDAVASVQDASGGFAGVYSANQTFKIIDGGRVEFQLDMVNNIGGNSSYSVLGYLPVANPAYIYGLLFYHVAHDSIGHTIVVNGKGYNEWWGGRNDIQPPTTPPGARYTLTMTGEGNNCRIESRIEDLNVADVNDPARVVWQTEFVDTPAADPGLNEASLANPLPYLNADGRFTISTFNSGALPPTWAEALYDNAVVHQTLPARAAPIVANVAPTYGANFLASSTAVAFDATDTTNIPLGNLVVTLNGVQYTNGSPGVTITPTGASSTTRHFSLASALSANVNYVGSLQATDAYGLTTVTPLVFDTFSTNDYVVESEDYNFTLDAMVGGTHLDHPSVVPENAFDATIAYNSQLGLPEVDYRDNRGAYWGGGFDANHAYRTQDPVYTSRSADPRRAKYVSAGAPGDGGFNEEEVTDIYDGDWLNYTHAYAAGTYKVFLRQATFRLLNSLVTLERVKGDPTTLNQTPVTLGSFAATPTGIGLFLNVPLTDGLGNPLVLRFSGAVDTLRVMNRVTGNANLDIGNLEQNYFVLVPVADPGTLRPIIAMVQPVAGAVVGGGNPAPSPSATIVNRDTSVAANSIIMLVNGAAAPGMQIVSGADGATVTWSPAGTSPTVTNTLIFQDTASVWQTNTWTYSYAGVLPAPNSLPVGSLSVRGFDARMVQSAAANLGGGNSVAAAEAVLAVPPTYAVDLTTTNLVQLVAWDLNASAYGAVANFPGLCIPPANINSFAIEIFTYLQLTAGPHRLLVDSDDAVAVYSGANLRDPSAVTLVSNNGVTHAAADFFVPADGLYPFRIVYEEGGGAAYLVLKSVNPTDNSTNLVNAAGGANAYYPLVCKSSTSVTGPYTADAVANAGNVLNTVPVLCDGTGDPLNLAVTGGTLTIPISGPAKFYRLDSPRGSKITGIRKVGTNVVITYQAF